MSGQKGSSKADTLVKVVLVLFISLLSFSVGTFVGSQVKEAEHRNLTLQGEYGADRQVASAEGHDEAGHTISEKEVEDLTEEFVNKEKSREPAHAEEPHAEPAAHGKHEAKPDAEQPAAGYKAYERGKNKPAPAEHAHAPAHAPAPKSAADHHAPPAPKAEAPAPKPAKGHDAPAKAAEKVSQDKAPTDGRPEERKPTSVLPSVASSAVGKYTVQVASFADEQEAKNRAAELKSKGGWQAFYLPATVNGKPWFRVMVGLFQNYNSAQDFRAQFMKETNTSSAIVQKIVQ